MKRTIFFDMDGTLNRLYDYPNWLELLRAHDPEPYAEAEVLHNMSLLARYLNKVQALGYTLGVISWLSKASNDLYDEAVTAAKLAWLNEHLHSVHFDEVYIVAYGTPKANFMNTDDDILFDDNEEIRDEWEGEAYEPSKIMDILKELVEESKQDEDDDKYASFMWDNKCNCFCDEDCNNCPYEDFTFEE